MTETVEQWAPLFTRYYTDEALLEPGYALGSYDSRVGGQWCKLCDGPVRSGQGIAHLAEHARELTAWRKRRKAEADRKREALLAERSQEKKLAREVGEGISTERYLQNKITSARHKLVHPEKHRREQWTEEEAAAIRQIITDTKQELAELREEA